MDQRLNIGQFVKVRDSVWKVSQLQPLPEERMLIELLPIGEKHLSRISVVTPPEVIEPLDPPDLVLNKSHWGPIGPWQLKHDLVSASCVRESDWLSGCRFGRVALEAYQVAPVLRILSSPKPSLLIADDVGLGKTIEAGLCLLELKARGRANRVLVVVPPGLILQWQEEMRHKFNLDFTLIENASGLDKVQMTLPAGANPWEYVPYVITSVDYLKKREVLERAVQSSWDVIIADEAHYLAESGSPFYPYRTARTRLGERLREACTSFILLTATPHNGYSHSFRSLIQLVEPTAATLWGDPDKVRERVSRTMIRRMKVQIKKKGKGGARVPAFPERSVESIKVSLSPEEVELFQQVSSYCSKTAKAAEKSEDEELITFAMQIIKKRMLSSRNALRQTIENRLEALKSDKDAEEPPPKVEIKELQADLPLSDVTLERISRRILRSSVPKEERRRNAEKRALASLKKSLSKLPDGDPKIEALLRHLEKEVLPESGEKVIIFTEYLDTLASIREAIDDHKKLKGSYEILRGGMSGKKRAAVQAKFERPEVRILLATDAASEGLNLQRFCRRVIHFELPWNPNRMEQRNGRVDRYGQARDPIIRYLYFPDSPEDDILREVLVEKIKKAQVSGVSTPDTLGVISGMNLEGELTKIDATEYGQQKKQTLLKVFEDRTAYFIKNVKPLLPQHGFEEKEEENIERLLVSSDPLLSDDSNLEGLVKARLGNKIQQDGSEGVFKIDVPKELQGPGVKPQYPHAAFRRSVAIKFPPKEVEFINILHPLFRAMFTEARLGLTQPSLLSAQEIRGRLAARRSKRVKKPTVIFSFLGSFRSGAGQIIEERVIPVGFDEGGKSIPLGEAEQLWGSTKEPSGEVSWNEIELKFGKRFKELTGEAEGLTLAMAQKVKIEILQKRKALSSELMKDLDAYRRDRLQEIDKEEKDARLGGGEQLLLFGREVSGFQAKRERVKTYVSQREKEIKEFESILDPDAPIPLGALFLFPA